MKIWIFIATGFFLVPNFSFAVGNVERCLKDGYTVLTLNGVFTDEKGAKKNSEDLKFHLGGNYKGEKLKVDYVHNATHVGGLGDLLASAYQKYFDSETVEDYDLVEMLKAASEKVTTQKLLLVGHSQGNFYANSFYDKVAGQEGRGTEKKKHLLNIANPPPP